MEYPRGGTEVALCPDGFRHSDKRSAVLIIFLPRDSNT